MSNIMPISSVIIFIPDASPSRALCAPSFDDSTIIAAASSASESAAGVACFDGTIAADAATTFDISPSHRLLALIAAAAGNDAVDAGFDGDAAAADVVVDDGSTATGFNNKLIIVIATSNSAGLAAGLRLMVLSLSISILVDMAKGL